MEVVYTGPLKSTSPVGTWVSVLSRLWRTVTVRRFCGQDCGLTWLGSELCVTLRRTGASRWASARMAAARSSPPASTYEELASSPIAVPAPAWRRVPRTRRNKVAHNRSRGPVSRGDGHEGNLGGVLRSSPCRMQDPRRGAAFATRPEFPTWGCRCRPRPRRWPTRAGRKRPSRRRGATTRRWQRWSALWSHRTTPQLREPD